MKVDFSQFGGDAIWETVNVPSQSLILSEGASGTDFFVVKSGVLRVTKKDGMGQDQELARLGEGDFFGEGSLLMDEARGATVQAMMDSVLLKLSREKFKTLLLQDQKGGLAVLLNVIHGLHERVDLMNKRVLALCEVPAMQSQKGKAEPASMRMMLQGFFSELAEVLHHGTAVFFGKDGLPELHSNVSEERLMSLQSSIPDVARWFMDHPTEDSRQVEDAIYYKLHTEEQPFLGILLATLCTQCQTDDGRLMKTISEQIGNILGQ